MGKPGWREAAAANEGIGGVGGAPGTRSAGGARAAARSIAAFFDVGTLVPGGLPFQPWARALQEQAHGRQRQGQSRRALPADGQHAAAPASPAAEDRSVADVIVILYEGNGGVRQIFTDGRPLPTNEPQPWWFGYSIGRWEGDTLVVQTGSFRDGGWLDVNGSPLTDAARMTERFRRVNYGTLDVQVTVDDPKAYTKPWTVTITQRLMPDNELIEFICQENEQSSQHFK